MALVNIDEKTLVQKLKTLVLGKHKPSKFRRISVIFGFGIWLYFTLWQGLIFLSIILRSRLKNPEMVESAFDQIGMQFGFMHRWGLDTIKVLLVHSMVVLIFYFFSLIGLILIYREKKSGNILYGLSNGFVMLFTFIFLGFKYVKTQISLVDIILFGAVTLYFLLCLFFFKKK
jgi:hypothetical protein